MQELIDTLDNEQCTLVVLHEGKIRTFNGHGVRRLYNISQNEPELLLGSKIAVKALGRSAARMMVDGGVKQVWAEYISQQAYDVLQDAGVVTDYGRKFDHNTFLDIWKKLNEE